jgi:hypothetical protein
MMLIQKYKAFPLVHETYSEAVDQIRFAVYYVCIHFCIYVVASFSGPSQLLRKHRAPQATRGGIPFVIIALISIHF